MAAPVHTNIHPITIVGTPAQDFLPTRFRSLGVVGWLRKVKIGIIPIRYPFAHVSRHIEQTVGAGAIGIILDRGGGILAIPIESDEIHQGTIGSNISPGIETLVLISTGGFLPLRFAGQPFADQLQ